MGISSDQLKQLLLDYDLLTPKQVDGVLKESKDENIPFEKLLVSKNLINDQNLGQLIADFLSIPFVFLRKKFIEVEVLKMIPESVATARKVISFDDQDGYVFLAMNVPTDEEVVRLLERKFRKKIKVFYATEQDINEALVYYKKGIQEEFEFLIQEQISEAEKAVSKKEEEIVDVPVVRIVDTVLRYAYDNRSSDVHIEPQEDRVMIRFRVDGVLKDVLVISKLIHNLVVSRIKVMSKMRTDEHMSAQDGKFRIRQKGYKVDVRVSIIPITEGEKVVLRLLTARAKQLSLQDLGFADYSNEVLKRSMKRPHGMILATGPTGSGKTTTLYAILQILNKRTINISTIEDPVEYDLKGANQIQVNSKTNLTFAKGLRSILRQDPDIIMVGEIRDEETASISTNAALTGHLVLSTLHTNDAATTLPRLMDMKIEPYLVSSSVNVAIAQRLVRKICPKCISAYVADQELDELKSHIDIKKFFKGESSNVTFYKGKGCDICNHTGYTGRVGLFEILELSDSIKDMVMQNANASEIRKQAVKEGMVSMMEDGIYKVINGMTTLEEVLRVSISD